ncbi:hypothetical protein [Calothrix sp. NIES-3974]|uniref:hypothetical protein n=1 Tax=Calothrix sp. NIES-3974 TaxID=2005462 RepID=UPI000B5F43C0|nr:hypothetical protein [Calothrix sp. NIES-3974]BAZ08052.1 RNA-directed DNA polymerase [Calothrix sp. NIES-3974]
MVDIVSKFLNLNNFQAAWEKVAANRGGAGIDGETMFITTKDGIDISVYLELKLTKYLMRSLWSGYKCLFEVNFDASGCIVYLKSQFIE